MIGSSCLGSASIASDAVSTAAAHLDAIEQVVEERLRNDCPPATADKR